MKNIKYLLNALLIGLMPSLSIQQQFRETSVDDLLLETKNEENNFMDITSKLNGLSSSGIMEQHFPNLKLFQFDAAEFYRQLNVTMAGYNFSLTNSSYDFEYGCYSGKHADSDMLKVLYLFACISGLIGNTLVIYVVLRFSKMQTVANIYILNLAIADECFLIGIPFLLYTMQFGSWPFGEYACKAYMVSTSITQFTSSIFLLIMSADRYMAICHPISSTRFRNTQTSKIVSLFAWLASVSLMFPVILFANTVENGAHISCNIKWPEANSQSGTTFILYSFVLGFATPLVFILIFYCLVIIKLHNVGPKQHKSKEKKRSNRKVTRLVLTVISVYIFCWLPYWICQVALIASPPSKCASRLEITIFLGVGCLAYLNSAINPVLYAFLSENFRNSFFKACSCIKSREANNQLQIESSFFSKFKKSKTERKFLPKNKNKHKNSILNSSNYQSKNLITSSCTNATTNCTTTTTTLEAGNNIVICPTTQKKQLLETPANQIALSCNNHQQSSTFIHQQQAAGLTENSNLESSSDCSDSSTRPPVLHTDL